MMAIKIIKTDSEYQAALRRIQELMDALPDSLEEEELELLVLVVEKYEAQHYPMDLPDPVEAIKFRMEQEGLTNNDLIPYLGSQSKVSEVLNYKRPLSLNMIRNLHRGLEIPAEVLIQIPGSQDKRRRYETSGKHSLLHAYINFPTGNDEHKLNTLLEWQSIINKHAREQNLPIYDPQKLDRDFFQELVRLSSYSAGPQMACELLTRHGIYFKVQKNISNFPLDGACFFTPQEPPIIAMTLRNPRLDDFWFTLLHLLGHLYLNRNETTKNIFDSMQFFYDYPVQSEEKQVNHLLKNLLVNEDEWRTVYNAYLRSQSLYTLEQGMQTLGLSMDMIYCLLRLEQEELKHNETVQRLPTRKINEKLEVYG